MTALSRLTLLAVLLAIGLGAAWMSYRGVGTAVLGAAQMRAGSVGGPRVVGGGPGVGK